ncbi:ClpP/crotonase-like domain-containing protein [Pterulicium gracile]|uniref:ClpP/crotonase-like domain-containing protein n=1 Tax=Pterulicium gracile TaxID=1884261 RepID=A0A5C3QMD5_9AGAR|nr:ClpP/crotonase-like domain-containing protein [Pterula gracilis]
MAPSSTATPDPEPHAVAYTPSPTKGIATITLNRPHRRNAIDPLTARKLYKSFQDFENDDSQKVCVFYGLNGTFCAGADLQDVAAITTTSPASSSDPDSSVSEMISSRFQPVSGANLAPVGPSRMQPSKPVICAVSGYAVAGGLELSLLADMRIVEEDAIFGVFCRRFGVPFIDGGTVRLPAVIGLGRALDLLLTGRPVDAQEAFQMGLANRVVPKGKAVEEAMKLAELVGSFPQLCMRKDRASAYHAVYGGGDFEEKMSFEFNNAVEVLTKESLEGARRFAGGQGRGGKL